MVDKENSSGRSKIEAALVCRGTGCVAGGSDKIYDALKREIELAGLKDIKVDFTGCHGFVSEALWLTSNLMVTFTPR